MGWGFRHRRGAISAGLDLDERAVIASLFEQTGAILAPEAPERPQDPFEALIGSIDLPADLAEQAGQPVHPRGTDPGDRDPALARLLPDAHRGDPAVAAEFRRLAEDDLRRGKVDNLTRAAAAFRDTSDPERVVLDLDTAAVVLVALTDARLLIAERLGLHEEGDWERIAASVQRDPTSMGAYTAGVYEYLTMLQETLAHSVSSAGPWRGRPRPTR